MRLKFGKVGLLFLALVISLAGIGGAFAAWTTEVTFQGQVETGTVKFDPFVKFSGTEVWKIEPHDVLIKSGWLDEEEYWQEPANNLGLIGWAKGMQSEDPNFDVLFEYYNIFPCVDWCADVLVHYTGSVPVMVTFEFDEGDLDPRIQRTVSVYKSCEAGSVGDLIAVDEAWQMHFCEYVVVKVCLYVPQIDDLQGQNYTFSGRIHAIQWNKYEPPPTPEVLYLSEEAVGNESRLFRVTLDDATLHADLELLAAWNDFPQPHIAHAVDKDVIYAVDKDTSRLRVYDVVTGTYNTWDVANEALPVGVVLAAMSPEGRLYVLSQNNNTIYEIVGYDTNTPQAVLGATVDLNVSGADIAFTSTNDGTLYLWTNASEVKGLYTLDVATGTATLVSLHNINLTGLAVRDNGTGHLVGSEAQSNNIHVFNRNSGEIIQTFTMYLNESVYNYTWGDMSIGQFAFD